MAGGKETPRQKMIGMMYLVLTALLALNVSKQVIAAFITLNDKLDASAEIIDNKVESNYNGFDQKRAALSLYENPDMTDLDLWQDKATALKSETALIVSYLLGECNDMIVEAEGESWIEDEKEIVTPDGGTQKVITKLKPLDGIQAYDNYDIPTNMFIGGNPNSPDQRGLDIRLKILEYRDKICTLMGTYSRGEKKFDFIAPANEDGLNDALLKCNPEDTAKIRQVYVSLSLPEEMHAHEQGELPWPSAMFDHAPIVAAAAMFTSLKLDIKNAEAYVSEYMLAKVEAPLFDFDTIEPLAFAPSSYMNAGDSMALNVKVAAYNSQEIVQIRYGIDADTANPSNWKETDGAIPLYGESPGNHTVKGQIALRERGEIVWKDFRYDYNVGQPMGVVASPEMRVLYWGYDNIIEGTASGYDPSQIQLRGNGCRLTKTSGGKYIAKVENGTRNASISVSATNPDGSTVSLGSFPYVCKPFPAANVYVAGKKSGESVSYTAIRNTNKVSVAIDPSSPITTANYTIVGGSVFVSGIPGVGAINSGGTLDSKSKQLCGQSRGKTIVFEVKYRGPDGVTRIATYTGRVS